MKKFEYLVKDNRELPADELEGLFRELGDFGWELVSTYERQHLLGYQRHVFKREKQEL